MAAEAMLATTVATRRTCGEGPVGTARRGWLVHQPVGSSELPAPSTLPVSDVFMGYS